MMHLFDDVQRRVDALSLQHLGLNDAAPDRREYLSDFADLKHLGGGWCVTPRKDQPIRELHLFPHSGTSIPREVEPFLETRDPDRIAQVIFDNADSATGALSREIAMQMAGGRFQDIALAGFSISRVILDSNRLARSDQFPAAPYRGERLLGIVPSATKRLLLSRLFIPWFRMLQALLQREPIEIVVHHHTFDVIGSGTSSYEHDGGTRRPAGMIFSEYVAEPRVGESKPTRVKFMPETDVAIAREMLEKGLRHIDSEARVTVDWPYKSPRILALGLAAGKRSPIKSLVYEVRKDLPCGHLGFQMYRDAIWDMIMAVRQ